MTEEIEYNERESLDKPLIFDRVIEIKTDMRNFEVEIFHNYHDIDNVIKALERAIEFLKSTPKKESNESQN